MANVIQINLGRSANATTQLELEISKHNKTKIVLIQEPNAKGSNIRGLMNGKTLTYNGILRDNENVRAAIWIENNFYKNCQCHLLGEFTNKDQTTIQITIEQENKIKKKIVLSSAYMPSNYKDASNKINQINDPITDIFNNLVKFCQNKNLSLIIGCDSNAHNTIWGNIKNNKRGENFLNYLIAEDLYVHNTGNDFTYSQNETKTIIDLTITNYETTEIITNWKVVKDDSFSDHRAISFNLTNSNTSEEKTRIKKRTNWIKFKNIISNKIKKINSDVETNKDLDRLAEEIKELLVGTYKKCCREKKQKKEN